MLAAPDESAGAWAASENGEPTPAWVAAALGVSLEDADWLLVLYRFAPALDDDPYAASRPRLFCEPL